MVPMATPGQAPSGRPVLWRRRGVVGAMAAVGLVAASGGAMFPIRAHLSVATTALVLVIPVVVAVAIGGFTAGVVATLAGFLLYDVVFIPPYYTLYVGAAQNWTALGVYAVVMVVVARVVAQLNVARRDAQRHAAEVRRLFDLSELLVRESLLDELMETIVKAMVAAFDLEGGALLLPGAGGLEVVASAGAELQGSELRQLAAPGDQPVPLADSSVGKGSLRAVALTASGNPIGLLALQGLPTTQGSNELLRAFANHLALALERAQLREQALRGQVLEQMDRLRRSLVGAVSHDLRTPLASIKVSTSSLLDPQTPVEGADARELLELIDAQADRLDRLVANLLDMTRIQSGALELRPQALAVGDLVEEALSVLRAAGGADRVQWMAPPGLPFVEVDHVLICQVLVNLIDNAVRYSPSNLPVTVSARASDGSVEVAVSDRGPGVAPEERPGLFEMFNRREAGGRGGLGLAIARAFVEAHGERIWVEDGPDGGSRFAFTLPAAKDH